MVATLWRVAVELDVVVRHWDLRGPGQSSLTVIGGLKPWHAGVVGHTGLTVARVLLVAWGGGMAGGDFAACRGAKRPFAKSPAQTGRR